MRSLGSGRSGYGFEGLSYGDTFSLLLLADGSEALSRGHRAAAAAQMRIIGEAAPAEAQEAIERVADVDAILADVEDAAHLADLIPILNDAAARGCRVLVAARGSAGQAAGALPLSSEVRVIGEATADDIVEGLHAANVPARLRLHDVKNAEAPRLQQLSAEVGRIANILATLSAEEKAEEANPQSRPRVDAGLVRSIIRARRLRDHYFRSELFADPAWDMLLDLYAARLDRQRVAVSSLCIAAAVPATTALRWIKSLTDQRLFVRIADPQDGRRVFIELSDEAAAGLEAYLVAAQRISPIIV